MKTTFLILSIIIITSCVRPQLKPQAPIIPGDSILVSISNLLIDEIDTNTLNHYKIDLNHSSCIDSSIVPTIHYWGLDTSGKFTDQEKINILKFNSHKCDSLILDKSKLKTQRLLKIKSKFNERYSINISNVLLNDSMDEAYAIIGTYFKSINEPMINGGWEEIVIFKKSDSKWNISKRLQILDY